MTQTAQQPSRPDAATVLRAYVTLTKPRIALLLLITCWAAMLMASGGSLDFWVLVATTLGMAMSSGGSSALNHVLDRDLDAKMTRTQDRPVVLGTVSPTAGTIFGLTLMTLAGVLLYTAVNPLTALLGVGGGAFYVLGYTVALKRYTPQNIVIGGAAGAVPPLVGWAAVTGTLDPMAWFMFAIIFLWTPPHFWALAIMINRDYVRAGVPMMPAVKGIASTATQIIAYSVVLTAVSLIPVFTGDLSIVYTIAAAVLGGRLVAMSVRLWQAAQTEDQDAIMIAARAMFLFSMLYLAVLFGAMVVDYLVIAG